MGFSLGSIGKDLNKILSPSGSSFRAGMPPQIDFSGQLAELQKRQGDVYSQQQNLANALLQQSQGQGPNPAMAMLQQQTGQNVAQQGALMAGARGASSNPALIARQAAMQGAGIQQNAIGQAAIMQAQQQMAAQQALAQQQQIMGGQALQSQGNIYGAIGGQNAAFNNAQSINAGVATGNQQAKSAYQTAIMGGMFNALSGSAASSAAGGGGGDSGGGGAAAGAAMAASDENQKTDIRSGVNEISSFLDALKPEAYRYKNPGNPGTAPGQRFGVMAQDLEKSQAGSSLVHDTANGKMIDPIQGFGVALAAMGELNERLKSLEGGKKMSKGGVVPGKAEVGGDSKKNDKIKTLLSPGEAVIPRSIMESENAPEMAASFVAQLKEKKKRGDYSQVVSASENAKQLACGGYAKMAFGGYGEDPEDSEDEPLVKPQPSIFERLSSVFSPQAQAASDMPMDVAQDPADAPMSMGAATPPVSSINQTPMQTAMPDPMSEFQNKYNKTLGAMEGATRAEAKGIMNQNDQMAKAEEQREAEAVNHRMQVDQQLQKKQKEVDTLSGEIADHKVDTSRWWGSKSTENKIGTIAAVLLGGLGQGMMAAAGMSGARNMALDVMNKSIDDDINIQKGELGKKESLLAQKYKEHGDIRAAEHDTRIAMEAAFQGKLRKLAMQSGNPIIQARAEKAIAEMKASSLMRTELPLAQYQVQKQQQQQAQAVNRGVNDIMANGRPADIENTINQLENVDPKKAQALRERFVPGVGLATTNEGAKGLREMQTTTRGVSDGIRRLREITDTDGKSLSPNLRAEADSIRQALVGSLRVPITGPGSMSDGERELLQNLVPDVTSITSLDSNSRKRLDTLEDKMVNSYRRMLESNGIKIKKGSGNDRSQAEAWLADPSNKNHPKYNAVKASLGQ